MKFVNPAESRLATPGLVHETVRLLSFHFGCPRRETGDMTSTLTPRSVYKDVLGGIVFLDHGAKMVPFFGSFFLCLEEGLYAVLVVRLDLLDLGQRRDLGSGSQTINGKGGFFGLGIRNSNGTPLDPGVSSLDRFGYYRNPLCFQGNRKCCR